VLVSVAALCLPTKHIFQSLTECFQATNPTVTHKTVTAIIAIAAPIHTMTDRNSACATALAEAATPTAATTRTAMAYTRNTAITNPTTPSIPARHTAPIPPALGPTAPTQAARTALSTGSTPSKKTCTADKTATVAVDSRARSRKMANTTHSNSRAMAAAVQCSHPAVRGNLSLWAVVASPTSPRHREAICLLPHARSRRRRRAGSRGVSAKRSRSPRIGRQISFLRWIKQDTRISSALENNVKGRLQSFLRNLSPLNERYRKGKERTKP
jgi:hypothetical protein